MRPAVTFPAKEHCYRLLVEVFFHFIEGTVTGG